MVRRREGQRMTALLEGVLENAPVGLGFLDRDLNIRHMNKALESMSERGFGTDLGAAAFIAGRIRSKACRRARPGSRHFECRGGGADPERTGRHAALPDELLPAPHR